MRPLQICALLVIPMLASCAASDSAPGGDVGLDARPTSDTTLPTDAAADGPARDLGGDVSSDLGVDLPSPADLPANATLLLEQLHTDLVMGESALIVGPDGTTVLVDVGSAMHAGVVVDAVKRRVGKAEVDWIVLTHFHADHIGALAKLVGSAGNPGLLKVKAGIVTRGLVDLDGDQLLENAVDSTCKTLTAPAIATLHVPLCAAQALPSCGSKSGAPWPAKDCEGLLRGDLRHAGDDAAGLLSYIPLGGAARLYFPLANGWVATKTGLVSAASAGVKVGHGGTHPENGRSLVGVLRWANFGLVFSGDLTTEVEGFLAGRGADLSTAAGGGQPLLSPGSCDVAQLGHHGFDSSSSQPWVDWLLPADGKPRNAIIGAATSYVLPPQPGVLSRVGPRLNGGFIWLTTPGLLGVKQDPAMKVANGAIVLRVGAGGSSYNLTTLSGGVEAPPLSFQSTP